MKKVQIWKNGVPSAIKLGTHTITAPKKQEPHLLTQGLRATPKMAITRVAAGPLQMVLLIDG